MKGSDAFKATIQAHLNQRAAEDELFTVTLQKPAKNIDACLDYIFEQVQKSGRNGFTDDEIYNMAVHYYDEDDIKPAKAPAGGSVVVNHVPELSEQEKKEAKEAALKKITDEEAARIKKKPQPKKPEATTEKPLYVQQSLF